MSINNNIYIYIRTRIYNIHGYKWYNTTKLDNIVVNAVWIDEVNLSKDKSIETRSRNNRFNIIYYKLYNIHTHTHYVLKKIKMRFAPFKISYII